MARFTHVHVKTVEPESAAGWFTRAFGFRCERPERIDGSSLVRCLAEDGTVVAFSNARSVYGEVLADPNTRPRSGLDHIGFESEQMQADLDRLTALGATLLEGPHIQASGAMYAFIDTPGGVRVELLQQPGSAS